MPNVWKSGTRSHHTASDAVRAISAGFAIVIALTSAGPARADGCFAPRINEADIREPSQKAFIVHTDGIEDLVLSVTYEGAADDFVWLVPVPAPPKVRTVPTGVFEGFSMMTRMNMARLIGVPRTKSSPSMALSAERHAVGPYSVVVLAGGDGSAWSRWLTDHGYEIPLGGGDMFDHYATAGWHLVVSRLAPAFEPDREKALAAGVVAPLWLQFRAEEPVYPLRISRLGRTQAEILLYVLADDALVVETAHDLGWSVQLFPFSRRVFEHCRWGLPFNPEPLNWNLSEEDHENLASLSARCRQVSERGVLTKLRAKLPIAAMSDLSFETFDAERGLASSDEIVRIQTLLLQAHRQQRGDLVLEHLRTHDTTTFPRRGASETLVAIAALGAFHDIETVSELARRIDHPQTQIRNHAWDAMATAAPGYLEPRTLAGLMDGADSGPRAGDETCSVLGWVVRMGCGEPWVWRSPELAITYGGDPRGRHEESRVRAELADKARMLREEPGLGTRTRPVTPTDPEYAAYRSRYGFSWPPPPASGPFYTTWRYRPNHRVTVPDSVLAVLAADPALSLLETALAVLSADPSPGHDLSRLLAFAADPDVDRITYLAVAAALAKNREVEPLLEMWRRTAGDDPDTRDELAWCLAYTADPETVPALVEHVQRTCAIRPVSHWWHGWYSWALERVPGLAAAVERAGGVGLRWKQFARNVVAGGSPHDVP